MPISSKDSAVARTPVELWIKILSYLVDDGMAHPLCDPIEFEEYNFHTSHGHCFDHSTYELLRAVCQSWKTIAERCARIPQEITVRGITVSERISSRVGHRCVNWFNPPSTFPNISDILGAPSCRVIHIHIHFLPGPDCLRAITNWIAGLHSLRGLCLLGCAHLPNNNPFKVLFRLLSGTCTRLISLHIGWVKPSAEPLSLPHLRSLIICFSRNPTPFKHYLSGWKLPSLTMFSLCVDGWQDSTSYMDLNIFLPFTKGIKALFLRRLYHPDGVIRSYRIDLEGIFPSLEYIFLYNTPLHLYKPIPPLHPLHTIKFAHPSLDRVFYYSILPPEEHKRQKLVKLYLKDEQYLLEDQKFLDALTHAGIEAFTWDGNTQIIR